MMINGWLDGLMRNSKEGNFQVSILHLSTRIFLQSATDLIVSQ